MASHEFKELAHAAFKYPAIDNHTHPLLKAFHRNDFDFEGLVSEAQGEALTKDAISTLACYRATKQLSILFGCENEWNSVKEARVAMEYEDLCRKCMRSTGIQSFLLDDLLDSEEKCEAIQWHDQYSTSPSKRIVRVEIIAQDILKNIITENKHQLNSPDFSVFNTFLPLFGKALSDAGNDSQVAGFKSIVCYRTGLEVQPTSPPDDVLWTTMNDVVTRYVETGKLRLSDKPLNDYIVQRTMTAAQHYGKPVQFHTGLGDGDIILAKSSPALLQPLLAAFPSTPVVLLHSSYPFTREAGYLTSIFKNVYLDFGEVFPFVSKTGQKNIVRQVLELSPTNKILWSTDGHWWPETYYLGAIQAREVLYEVLAESIQNNEVSEQQAVEIVRRALFENSNSLYKLGLTPDLELGLKASSL